MSTPTLRELYQAKNISIHPAGEWTRNTEGKKEAINANRADGLDFADFPKDCIAKYRIEEVVAPDDMRLIVIDADSQVGKDTAEKLFPQVKDTFSYQTSQSYKRHYLFYVPSDSFEEFRAVGALDDIDILTYGISFTAHFFKDADYELPDFTKPILTLDEKSQGIILASVDEKNASYKGTKEHMSFSNKEMAKLVIAYADGKLDISEKDKASQTNRNNLWKNLLPKYLKKKGQRKFVAPELSHDIINTVALLVAKNSKIPNDKLLPFMEKLLVEVYYLKLNSKLTQQHFYSSILPTLPYFESLINPMDDSREFDELIADNTTENTKDRNYKWVLFCSNKNGTSKYFQVNRFTYELREINGATLFDESYIRKWYPHLAQDDIAEVPQLTLSSNPYAELVEYDEKNEIFALNKFIPSKYKKDAQPTVTKPDNVLTQMIDKFFSNAEQEDFYYHWLAHLMFSSKPVTVVVWFASASNAVAGTGKTILSSALPAHLVGFKQALTVDSGVASAGWGAIFETKLLSYNDLNKMRAPEWDKLYAKIKDEASHSTSKLRNNKGGDITTTTLGICQSGSSNFIPKLDVEDRRFWLVSPKERLDKNGADKIHDIFEGDKEATYSEIQEVANYVAYLFQEHKDKYKTELYTRAPSTSDKDGAKEDREGVDGFLPTFYRGWEALWERAKEPDSRLRELLLAYRYIARAEGKVPTELMLQIYQAVDQPRDTVSLKEFRREMGFKISKKKDDGGNSVGINKYKQIKSLFDGCTKNGVTVAQEAIDSFSTWENTKADESFVRESIGMIGLTGEDLTEKRALYNELLLVGEAKDSKYFIGTRRRS